MSREAHIPIALWICAACVAHFAGGKGAVEVTTVVLDREHLRAAARFVREGLHPPDTTFEVVNVEPTPPDQKVAPPTKDAEPSKEPGEEASADDDAAPNPKDDDPAKPKPKPEEKKEPPKVAAVTPPPPAPLPPPLKPLKPLVPIVPVVPAPPAPPPPPLPQMDHRQATVQEVEKNQKDNPDAKRIADDANWTKDETIAKLRSHDQDSANPTPGKAHVGPSKEIGNDDHTKVASGEEHKGDTKLAPGESSESSTSAEHNNPAPPAPAHAINGPSPSMPGMKGTGGVAPAAGGPPPNPGGAGPASPEAVAGEHHGGWSIDPANPGGDGANKAPGRKRSGPSFDSPVHANALGLNGQGVPGGPNLNLNQNSFEQAVGEKKLKEERAAAGAAVRSAHLGSFAGDKWKRWKPAIENYEPSVKEGNQTSLNAAKVPFAKYLNLMHNRIHPIFAEEFLASLDGLPKANAMNQNLITHVEIVLSRDQGRIVRMGITKASGSTAFDIVALNSVERAAPFGRAPEAIVSPDGNVYLHWEFHRDPYDACTSRNARPFLLKELPKQAPTSSGAPPPRSSPLPTPDERPGSPGPIRPLRE